MINPVYRGRAYETGAGPEPETRNCTRGIEHRPLRKSPAGPQRRQRPRPIMWTAERIAALRRLVADPRRLTTREIASELGGVSRHAVIGKAGRLGLQLPNHGLRTGWLACARHRATGPAARRQHKRLAPMPAAPWEEPDRGGKARARTVAFLDLESHHCRWPHGRRPPFAFCGRQRSAGSPYCAMHTEASLEQTGRVQTTNWSTSPRR